ncbi:LacI family DNA-binding transcriptional regulator [Georgenia halophila]|uniref:LacI family DNA-binding transcriptional regulator n=1 Tax=Georgenia halophila TaxID=620889 RepID=A0ABP8LKJ1_9MICO
MQRRESTFRVASTARARDGTVTAAAGRSGSARPGRRPSVKDVAERAGVSWKTVSNVVNNRTNVRPETRARVEAAIRELGYRTSMAGRQLRSGRTYLLAVALPDLTMPYFAHLAHSIIRSAEARGYTVLISETNGRPESERYVAGGFDAQFADGIILRPEGLDSTTVTQAHGPLPLVLLGERVDGSHLDHVIVDNQTSGQETTQHLLDLGRRSLVFVGAQESRQFGPGWLRMLGYREAIEKAGIDFQPSRVVPARHFTRESGLLAVQELLGRGLPFDGLVCASDLIAIGAMHALRRRGLRVPEDVAVTGWDNIPEGAYSNPTLTTVAPDIATSADRAVELLVRRIEDQDAAPREVVAGHKLIRRESTAAAG